MIKAVLIKKLGHRVLNGHPWIFANEVKEISPDAKAGDIAEVYTHDNKFVGKGYVNPASQIIIRLLTRNKAETIDDEFFLRKIQQAWNYRQSIGYTENCRLVFGEADELPQLIIDKFNDHFVIQSLAYGIDVWKPSIVSALEKIFKPRGIYERNDVPVRELEGLPQQKDFYQHPLTQKL